MNHDQSIESVAKEADNCPSFAASEFLASVRRPDSVRDTGRSFLLGSLPLSALSLVPFYIFSSRSRSLAESSRRSITQHPCHSSVGLSVSPYAGPFICLSVCLFVSPFAKSLLFAPLRRIPRLMRFSFPSFRLQFDLRVGLNFSKTLIFSAKSGFPPMRLMMMTSATARLTGRQGSRRESSQF